MPTTTVQNFNPFNKDVSFVGKEWSLGDDKTRRGRKIGLNHPSYNILLRFETNYQATIQSPRIVIHSFKVG